MTDLNQYTRQVAQQARDASRVLNSLTGDQKTAWLTAAARALTERTSEILAANELDIAKAPEYGLTSAAIDRLKLTPERLEAISNSLIEIAALPDPVGEIFESRLRPNGLRVSKVRVPLGVVFFIFESRPNVTVDAAALCLKSGNAVILRGGKEALHSNLAFHKVLADTLEACDLPRHAVQLVNTIDREAVGHFLKLPEYIDVTIPRGGKSLIERVTAEATMPVIKHFDGICHVYVDQAADLVMASEIAVNSKTQRPGVCNAAESLLVHADVAETFLPQVTQALQDKGVEIRGCERTQTLIPDTKPATDEDFRTEYLELIISVKIVDNLEEAVQHINEYGSHHTDAIITTDIPSADRFMVAVDSSAVVVNASTRFNDGGEFGLGAEIGISTDKFHARGPCGLQELTSYKYLVQGSGQIRT